MSYSLSYKFRQQREPAWCIRGTIRTGPPQNIRAQSYWFERIVQKFERI